MDTQHRCASLNAMNVSAGSSCEVLKVGAQWRLALKSLALDQDVAAREATQVGEIMSKSELAINYCPFCGSLLN